MKQRTIMAVLIGLGSGIFVTPMLVLIAMTAAGVGHGSYLPAIVFFPFSMLLTITITDSITPPLMGLALVQFPLYGLAIGFSAARGWKTLTAVTLIIIAAHILAAVACVRIEA